MELQTHSSYAYMTAPSSPNAYSRSSSMGLYYSAPASPRRKPTINDRDQNPSPNFDDFEFETSKKFNGETGFLTNVDENDNKSKYRARGDSLSAIAFADELFHNGLVMPLKLPPRLQCEGNFNSFSQKSPVLSPKTVCKIPFARKSSWNDDFDPFLVAMEKVREENRGRNSHHRRSRSYSPFRAIPKCNIDSTNSPHEPMKVRKPSHSGPLDFKGSGYARWVRDQTREGGLSQRWPKNPRGFIFGQRIRPVKTDHDGPEKSVKEESKVLHKLKGLLLKYTFFGKENRGNKQESTSLEVCKTSYFSRLSFTFKEKGQNNGKKRVAGETKMAIVQYKPSR